MKHRWNYDWTTSLAGVVLTLCLVALQVWDPPAIEGIRLKIYDAFLRAAPREAADPSPVVLVDIDEQSLQEIGQWPWPRTVFAEMIERLGQMGAVLVTFDVVFPEPDRSSPANYATMISAANPELAAALRQMPDNDAAMAAAMQVRPTVLGQPASAVIVDQGELGPLRAPQFAELGGDPRPHLVAFPDVIRNVPLLENAASGVGLVTIEPEVDGIVRRVPLVARVGERILPSLTLESLRIATGETTLITRTNDAGIEGVVLKGVSIPTDRNGRIWINYSPRRPDQFVSAADVLAGRADPARIGGRFVIIGSSAAGLHDIQATPVDGNMPGPEIQLQVLETMLSNDHLRRPSAAEGLERAVTLVGGLLLSLVGVRLGAGWFPPLLLGTGLIAMGGSWFALTRYGLIVDGAYPTAALIAVVLWLALAKYIREETQRREIKNAFSHYLSPAMVDQLADNPGQMQLGGERRNMSILFSDIRSFTKLSEGYADDPEGLTAFLNGYFTSMTEAILEHEGTIDKYIGDAIMAFWNAPIPGPDHARQACLAAIDMIDRLERLNRNIVETHADATTPPDQIAIGIGINTGESFVGNMGSDQRFNYTVLGDTVNVAARVEGQTKTYGVPILICEATRERAGELATMEVDLVRLMGKQIPTRLHAVLGDDKLATQKDYLAQRQLHTTMLKTYRQGDWDAAEKAVASCRAHQHQFKLGKLYDLYLARIAEMRANPPGPDWDGVTVAEGK